MTYTQDRPEFKDWLRDPNGMVRLWAMQDFSCGTICQGIPVMRINFLSPPGYPVRNGTLQVHMSPQQAKQLSAALFFTLG